MAHDYYKNVANDRRNCMLGFEQLNFFLVKSDTCVVKKVFKDIIIVAFVAIFFHQHVANKGKTIC